MFNSLRQKEQTFTEEELLTYLKIDEVPLTKKARQSVRSFDGETCYFIGIWYYAYRYGGYDKNKGLAWFRRGAAHNHSDSKHQLGEIYLRGEMGVQDTKLALEWFLKAVETDENKTSCGCIAEMYEKGWGVPKNWDTAFEWYQKSAAKGHDSAQLRLSRFYKEDEKCRDLKKAAYWKKQAEICDKEYFPAFFKRFYSVIHDPEGEAENIGRVTGQTETTPQNTAPDNRKYAKVKTISPADLKRLEQQMKNNVNAKKTQQTQSSSTGNTAGAASEDMEEQIRKLKKAYKTSLDIQKQENARYEKEMEELKEKKAKMEGQLEERDEEIDQLKQDLARYKAKFKNLA